MFPQGHNTVTLMRLEPTIVQSRDMHSTIEPLRSQKFLVECVDAHTCTGTSTEDSGENM